MVADRLAPRELLGELPRGRPSWSTSPRSRAGGRPPRRRSTADRRRGRSPGKRVVRFKGGDSFVFGRGFEEVIACREAGVPVTVIPGLTSPIAVPALAGIPVTHRGVAHDFTVLSGHLPPDHPGSLVDWDAVARLTGTLLLMMAVENAPAIATPWWRAAAAASTPVAVVCDGSMPAERTVLATLGTLGEALAANAVRAPAIIVVGEVVAGGPSRGVPAWPTPRRGRRPARTRGWPTTATCATSQLRKHLEAEHGLFLAEGEKVVRRAVEAGFAAALVPDGAALARRPGRRARPHRRALLRRLGGAGRAGHRLPRAPRAPWPRCARLPLPVAGRRSWPGPGPCSCSRTSSTTPTSARSSARGAALGFDAVLLSPRCADPLYRRSIKVAMGAVFSLPWTRLASWDAALPTLSSAGFTTVALTLAPRRGARRGRRPRPRQGRPGPRRRGPRPLARAGRSPPTAAPPSPWPPASTRSTSPPPPPSPATSPPAAGIVPHAPRRPAFGLNVDHAGRRSGSRRCTRGRPPRPTARRCARGRRTRPG